MDGDNVLVTPWNRKAESIKLNPVISFLCFNEWLV